MPGWTISGGPVEMSLGGELGGRRRIGLAAIRRGWRWFPHEDQASGREIFLRAGRQELGKAPPGHSYRLS